MLFQPHVTFQLIKNPKLCFPESIKNDVSVFLSNPDFELSIRQRLYSNILPVNVQVKVALLRRFPLSFRESGATCCATAKGTFFFAERNVVVCKFLRTHTPDTDRVFVFGML